MKPETVELILGLAWPLVVLVTVLATLRTLRLALDRKPDIKAGAAQVVPPAPAPSGAAPPTLDLSTQHQAYSHLSRMHSSLAATFLATLLAYTAYIITLKKLPLDPSSVKLWILLFIPLPVLAIQGLKYFVTNLAFRQCALDIPHPGTDLAKKAGYVGKTLHEYLYDPTAGLHRRGAPKLGGLWLSITQRVFESWLLLISFVVALIIMLISFVPQEPV